MGVVDGIVLFRPLFLAQELFVELALNVDHLLFAPELREENGAVDSFGSADQRRTRPAQFVALFGEHGGLVRKFAGFGKTRRIHLESHRFFHQMNRFLKSLGNLVDGVRIVCIDGRMKRVESVGEFVLACEILEDPFSLLARLRS